MEITSDHDQLLYRKEYAYDGFGNPILEVFKGDLSGSGELESCTTKRLFSDDGKHLLLREELQSGKITTLSYLPNTNLVTVKLISDGIRLLKREFFVYDDCHNLIEHSLDNGTETDPSSSKEVTQKTITRYQLRQKSPFLHLPEWIEELYLDRRHCKNVDSRRARPILDQLATTV